MGGRARPYVLVVDDDQAMLWLVREVLTQEGIAVETADNGERALALMARQRPAVVLLDVQMPVLDGEGFVKEMRARRLDTPFVVVTGAPSAEWWATKLGADGAIQKPFSVDDVVAVASRYLAPATT